MLLAMSSANAQLALENFNAAGMPSGWTMISDANVLASTITPAWIIPKLNAAAWTKFPIATGDSGMITTSYFTPAAAADRWLITPSFNVTSALMAITWNDNEMSSSGASPIEVWVSTTGGATAASFTTKLLSFDCAPVGFAVRGASLAAFNGQSVRVAFRSVGNAKGFAGIDNVQTQVLPSIELALNSITPVSGTLQSYGSTTGTIPVSGVVKNNGATTVTSYKVNYQVGTGAVVSETKSASISALGTASFSFTTPITPTMSNVPVKVWVELAGDAVKTNDSLSTRVAGYTTKPTKKLLYEEATGTWCGWCPRGAIYMDSIYHKYPNNVSVVAVHNGDGMTVGAYDSYIGTFVGGYPSMVVDRRLEADPNQAFTIYGTESTKYGLADMVLTTTVSGTSATIKVDVKPTASTNADYRLVLVITEDRVTGYSQANYYSGGAVAMKNKEFDFVTLPDPVPASIMKYDFVARGIYPSPTGTAGSLPATMTSGMTYSYTFPAVTIDPTKSMRAIVLLVNGSDESVLNTQNIYLPTVSIKEVAAGVNSIQVYPNPASEVLTTKFTLENQSNVSIEIVDMLGKVVKTIATKNLTAGTYEVPTNVAEMASGIYLVKITTDGGSITERFSVAK
ncbi:MAG: choice-of-anchor J domain-containing protein [Phycisphaerales bacterium]|nr:choice-of-anchor J domain-containing protein [Phycisphaerales bacterium]